MPGPWYAALVVVLWLTIGLGTAAAFVTRGGHRSWLWYLIGGLLGPLFVPIAAERGRARPRSVEARPARGGGRGGTTLRVLVGVDGSPDADRALRALGRTLTGTAGELVLVTVLSPDLTEEDAVREQAAARALLDERVAQLPAELPAPSTEIVCGHPVDALLTIAESRNVDVLVVGRSGHELGGRLLGNVAEELVHRSPRAVLLGSLPGR